MLGLEGKGLVHTLLPSLLHRPRDVTRWVGAMYTAHAVKRVRHSPSSRGRPPLSNSVKMHLDCHDRDLFESGHES